MNTEFMHWDTPFLTGFDLVDRQHHALVNLVNKAAAHLALEDGVAQAVVGPLLDQLTRYAGVHFRDEEQLMHAGGLDARHIAHHQASHAAFVREVLQMRQQFDTEGQVAGRALLSFLANWLNFHILIEDQQMAAQLRAVAQGTPADQAWVQASRPESGAQAVVHRSLVALFTLLSQRNNELSRANQTLSALKTQLECTNESLEARVAERTEQLQATVARLQSTQSQLLQSEKMAAVGQLAAGVAHEINNPVGFVMSNVATLDGYVQRLLALLAAHEQALDAMPQTLAEALRAQAVQAELVYLREDLPDLLRETREGLQRVKRIVADLREFAHVDDGPALPVNLNDVAQRALTLAASSLIDKADLHTTFGATQAVAGQSGQLTQVVVNLLVNAAQAIAEHGSVAVRTGEDDKGAWLEVEDTGCGMPETVRQRIFEPFFTTKPIGTGTGLGLSVSWEIVQRHHGTLSVRSAVGQGSCFRLWLPHADRGAAPTADADMGQLLVRDRTRSEPLPAARGVGLG